MTKGTELPDPTPSPFEVELPAIGAGVHGPYEDAIIAIAYAIGRGVDGLKLVMDGQDAATKKELWTRWLDGTKPLHDLGLALSQRILGPLTKAISEKA